MRRYIELIRSDLVIGFRRLECRVVEIMGPATGRPHALLHRQLEHCSRPLAPRYPAVRMLSRTVSSSIARADAATTPRSLAALARGGSRYRP
jgi:hypothetical protein